MSMYTIINNVIEKEMESKIAKTWLSGGKSQAKRKSILMTIPFEYLKEYHLDKPAKVLVIPTENGLLIRKLVIPEA
jgi:hypothetical protein